MIHEPAHSSSNSEIFHKRIAPDSSHISYSSPEVLKEKSVLPMAFTNSSSLALVHKVHEHGSLV